LEQRPQTLKTLHLVLECRLLEGAAGQFNPKLIIPSLSSAGISLQKR
jgi:hypothetical protein